MKKILVLILSLHNALNAAQSTLNVPQSYDDISNISNPFFLSILDQTVEFESEEYTDLPENISFFSADAKFDGTDLKFCEIGNGLYGIPLPSYVYLQDQKSVLYAPYWEFLWLYASQFNLPIWCISKNRAKIGAKTLTELIKTKKCNGQIFDDIESFEKFFEKNLNKKYKQITVAKPKSIQDYIGILAYAGTRIDGEELTNFQNRHPEILFINNFPALYQRRKDQIHAVFNDDFLSQFRPRWGVYPTEFRKELVTQIKEEIHSKYYVIKPIVGKGANGVMIADEKELESILKTIIKASKTNATKINKKNKFAQWYNYQFDKLIIEEFVESKKILHHDKPYDLTLRLGFILSKNSNKISVNVIAAFWKPPHKALDENGSLTEKHISKSMVGTKEPGIAPSPDDLKKIRVTLYSMLPKLYEKILTQDI